MPAKRYLLIVEGSSYLMDQLVLYSDFWGPSGIIYYTGLHVLHICMFLLLVDLLNSCTTTLPTIENSTLVQFLFFGSKDFSDYLLS